MSFYFIKSVSMTIEQSNGGKVTRDAELANVILVHMNSDSLTKMRYVYDISDHEYQRRAHVEKLSFVTHCISTGLYKHRVTPIKAMSGRPIGRQYVLVEIVSLHINRRFLLQ